MLQSPHHVLRTCFIYESIGIVSETRILLDFQGIIEQMVSVRNMTLTADTREELQSAERHDWKLCNLYTGRWAQIDVNMSDTKHPGGQVAGNAVCRSHLLHHERSFGRARERDDYLWKERDCRGYPAALGGLLWALTF